jgi:hypothetical protein
LLQVSGTQAPLLHVWPQPQAGVQAFRHRPFTQAPPFAQPQLPPQPLLVAQISSCGQCGSQAPEQRNRNVERSKRFGRAPPEVAIELGQTGQPSRCRSPAGPSVTFVARARAGLAPLATERTFTAMTASGDQTMEVPTVIHLRGSPGVGLACGRPDGLWTRDLMNVTCRSCLTSQAVTRPIPAEDGPPASEPARDQGSSTRPKETRSSTTKPSLR